MRLSREEVEHVAYLARLGLTEEEVERFREQLSDILEYFSILGGIDVSGIPPTAQVIALQNVMSEDVARPSWPREDVLANAPRTEEGYLRVKAVLEEPLVEP